VLAGTADDKTICHFALSSPGMYKRRQTGRAARSCYLGALTKQGAKARTGRLGRIPATPVEHQRGVLRFPAVI